LQVHDHQEIMSVAAPAAANLMRRSRCSVLQRGQWRVATGAGRRGVDHQIVIVTRLRYAAEFLRVLVLEGQRVSQPPIPPCYQLETSQMAADLNKLGGSLQQSTNGAAAGRIREMDATLRLIDAPSIARWLVHMVAMAARATPT
jgi:hypothetical protein